MTQRNLSPFDSLETRARIHPRLPALEDSNEVLDYRTLYLVAKRVAKELGSSGLKADQLVATALPPRLEIVVAMALFFQGIAAVSVVPSKPLPEKLAPDWLISAEPQPAFPANRTIILDQDWISKAVKSTPGEYRGFEHPRATARIFLEETDLGLVANEVSIEELMARVTQIGQFVAPKGPTLALTSLYKESGFLGALAELARGDAYLVVPERLDAAIALGRKSRVQTITGSLREISDLTSRAKERKLRFNEVSHVTINSSLVPKSVAESVKQQLGVYPLQVLRYPEVGIVASKICSEKTNPFIAGVALPGVSFRVVDAQGTPSLAGQVGFLEVASQIANPQEKEGWYRTNDLAIVDINGVLLLAPRIGNLLSNSSGSVDLEKIDAIIQSAPGVAEGMVFPFLKQDGGFQLVAAVVAGENFDDSKAMSYLREKLHPLAKPAAMSIIDLMPLGPDGLASREGLSLYFSEKVLASMSEKDK